MESFDVIVLGLGGIGSAAFCHLASRGHRVLGIDRFGAAHDRGSSHGETRILRKTYFEHPAYIPLLQKAFDGWALLELETDTKLVQRTGLLLLGQETGEVIPGVKRVARKPNVRVESLTPRDVSSRFPGFSNVNDMEAFFEPDAGYLLVESCVQAHIDLALRQGGTARFHEPVRQWRATENGVVVDTENASYAADRLVICAGAWAREFLEALRLPLEVRRKVVMWFDAPPELFSLESGFPAFCVDSPNGVFYGLPVINDKGMKVAEHTGGKAVDNPTTLDQALRPDDEDPVCEFIREYLPAVSGTPRRHSVCMYTMTPDEHFILDVHPEYPNVTFAAGFSGHGFKFAPVLGSILSDLVIDGSTSQPIDFLSASRFG